MGDRSGPDLTHPAALTRLTSTVLRFRCPTVSNTSAKLNFARSFKSVGTHENTQKAFKAADTNRSYLIKSLSTKAREAPHKTIVAAAERYIPSIYQILLTCRVQPESAQLDSRLVFEWSSGIESKNRFFKSEAMMYEFVMVLCTEAIATAGIASDACTSGDFGAASKEYRKAAGMMDFLANVQLPQWLSKQGVQDEGLPGEARVGTCEAFTALYLGIAQQMAVATVLNKKGKTPNWSMLSKLGLGISEQFEKFVSILRTNEPLVKDRMDIHFFTLMTFQIQLQKSLSSYYHARHYWEEERDFGLAIGMMSKAVDMLKTRTSPTGKGIPEIRKGSPLVAVEKDLILVKKHMSIILKDWEKDNSKIYFERVPVKLPVDKVLSQGTLLMKVEEYQLDEVDPLPLIIPESSSMRLRASEIESDAELARKLQEQLNAE